MTKKKKNTFEYLPQTILVILGLIAVFASTYNLFKGVPQEIEMPKDARITGETLVQFEEKHLAVSELLTTDKNLVIFWATWCAPCVDEIKEMPELLPKIKEKGYSAVFINYDTPDNKIIANNFAKEFGINTAFDIKGELLFNLGISSLPVSLVVDKSGRILKTLYGNLRESRL